MGIFFCLCPILILFLILTFSFKIKTLHLIITILLSILVIFPISIIQFLIPDLSRFFISPLLYSFFQSLIIYSFIEEIFKLLFINFLPTKKTTLLNFLMISLFFGLTLGCFESLIYFLQHLQSSTEIGGKLIYSKIFLRIFSSDIIHSCCAGLSGIFIFTKKNQNKLKISIIVITILLHALYDFFAVFNNPLKYFSIIVILLAIIECRSKYKNFS